ncbi:MAG: STAS domain-containing protein [Thermincola sp.]|nr:STAS domain-containing protein [Thermincola sp.]
MTAELIIKEEIKEGVFLLHLTGDITKTSGDELLRWRKWEEGLPEGIPCLIINFDEVQYINSAGIAALIRLVRLGVNDRYRSGCYGLSYHYEKLFTMVGLTKYIRIFPSEWAAVDGIKLINDEQK